jgi:hypothetical protein
MTVGYAVTKNDIDSTVGSLALTLRTNFDHIRNFKILLDTKTDPDLTGLGYTAGEVATLRSATADMDQLRTIYEGLVNLGSAKDFRTFTKLVVGVS